MGKRKHSSAPIKIRSDNLSRNGKMPVVLRTEDSLDFLPKGWIMEVRPRNGKSRPASTYKCYISPAGLKFYSKQQIFRHLETGLPRCSTSRSKSRSGSRSRSRKPRQIPDNVVTITKESEGLPPGWVTELKIQKKEGKIIRRDPYYTDPVTGYIFRSKLDVIRYLESGKFGPRAIKPKAGRGNLVDMDETISALIASKRQKVEGSTTRRRLFPGQSSKMNTSIEDDEWPGLDSLVLEGDDEFNENGHSGIHAREESVPTVPLSVVSSKNQQLQKVTGVDKVIPSVSAKAVPPVNQQQKMEKKGVETRSSSRRTQTSSSKPPADSELNKSQGPMLRSRRIIVSALPAVGCPENLQLQLKKGSGTVIPGLPALVTAPEKVEKVVPALLEEVTFPKKQNKLEKGVEKDVPVVPAVLVSPEKEQDKLEKGVEKIVPPLPGAAVSAEEQHKLEMGIPKIVPELPTVVVSPEMEQYKLNKEAKSGKRKTQPSSCKSNDGKQHDLPRRASKRLAGFNADLVPELVIRKQKSQVSAQVEDNKRGLQELHQHRCASGTNMSDSSSDGTEVAAVCEQPLNKGGEPLGMEEPSNKSVRKALDQAEPGVEKVIQKPEFPFTSPFGDSWPDPCLEFAFKTLTGAIPVDDNLTVQDYFQQQVSTVPAQNHCVQGLPDTSTDGFRKNNDLLRFDSMEKPASQPKLQDTVFPEGSGSMLNFGGNMHQQPTSDGNMLHFGGNMTQRQPNARGTK